MPITLKYGAGGYTRGPQQWINPQLAVWERERELQARREEQERGIGARREEQQREIRARREGQQEGFQQQMKYGQQQIEGQFLAAERQRQWEAQQKLEEERQGEVELSQTDQAELNKVEAQLGKLEDEYDMQKRAGGGNFLDYQARKQAMEEKRNRIANRGKRRLTAEEQLRKGMPGYSREEFPGMGIIGGQPFQMKSRTGMVQEMAAELERERRKIESDIQMKQMEIYGGVLKERSEEEAERVLKGLRQGFGGGPVRELPGAPTPSPVEPYTPPPEFIPPPPRLPSPEKKPKSAWFGRGWL